jgi:diacylglycerol kinase family enzyme
VAGGQGKGKYLWHIIKTILFYKEGKVQISSRGLKQESDCFINTISVGRRFAGSFLLTPQAVANDGLLDVCMIRKLNVLQRFKILPKVPKGTHILDKKVDYYQTDRISIDFGKKVPFHVDGELFFDSKFEVTILPAALNIIYNPLGAHFFNEEG